MSLIKHAFTISLFVIFPALAADQVVLSNGDIVTGVIVKKDGAKLTIKSEFLGEVTMPWSAVKSIRSDSEVSVVLPSGETVKGKLATAGDELQVTTPAQTKTAPLAAVTAVRNDAEQHTFERMQHPRLLELWTGGVILGFALARGNARSDSLTTAFTAVRATNNDKIATYFNQIYSSARANNVNSTTASAVRGGWKYNRNFGARMFATGFNDYEHDRFQDLSLRFVGGGGLGFRVAKSDRAQVDFDAGFDYQRENFLEGLHRNSAEMNFGDNVVYKLSKATTLNQSMRTFVNLSESGVYRLNFDLSANTVLKKWLGWNVTASDRFVSNPVLGNQRNDLLISTGFRVSFAK